MKKSGFVFLMPAAMLFALGACSNSSTLKSVPQQTSSISDKDMAIREVYELYAQSAKERGETPLSYEEWLASIKGEKGEKGQDGSSVLTGHGAPSASLGSDGDSYIDLDTWDYYVKAEGSWTKAGNIKGNKGEQGEKGDKGDQGEKGQDGITYIPCIFNNYDGSKLYEFYFEKGTAAVYEGETPTKPDEIDDGQTIHWTFKGWDKSLENIQKPTIFTAQYECLHTCTFKNYDGTTLWTTTVDHGKSVIYQGITPRKPDTVGSAATLQWTFTGWDKSLDNIKADTVFVAQYYAPNSIKCTFANYDGSILSIQYCGAGDRVNYEGETPTRPEDNDDEGIITKYEFTGWDKTLKNIQEDTTFTAQYSSSTYYECRFVNYDGALLYETSTIGGGQVSYSGDTPTRPQGVNGTTITDYTFSGWDKSLSNITEPTTFTAQYRSSRSFTGYKVTFLESDDSELYSYYCEQGTNAVYPYDLPFSYDSTNVNMFAGWSGSIKNITSATTVKATYKTISRRQNGEYPQTKVSDGSLISALNGISSADAQGYYVYQGDKYEKVYTNGSNGCKFSDGTTCQDYSSYWFKVEPIQWKLLSSEGGDLFLTSEYILDAHRYNAYYFYKDGYYANNYKNSEIRSWINDEFLDKAFYYDDSLIKTMAVDNSVASTGYSSNPSVCETTNDKIFLLSYVEATNVEYRFGTCSDRICKVTDYAIAMGAYKYEKYGSGYWWTRSPDDGNPPDSAWYVYYSGDVVIDGVVDRSFVGVRPALHFDLN